jgi:pyocin large subunit-like protein
MRAKALILIASVLFLSTLAVGCLSRTPTADTQTASAQSPTSTTSGDSKIRTNIGFASRRRLQEHYEKHGAEFGSITIEQYLLQAQTLRDRQVGGDVLEFVRADGVTTRYDRATGDFIAFNSDKTIRTYFKPNAGERYFLRQRDRD